MTIDTTPPAIAELSLTDRDRGGVPIMETLIKFKMTGDYWLFDARQLREMLSWIERNTPLKYPLPPEGRYVPNSLYAGEVEVVAAMPPLLPTRK